MRRYVSVWFLALAATFAVLSADSRGYVLCEGQDGLCGLEHRLPGSLARVGRSADVSSRVAPCSAAVALAISSDALTGPRADRAHDEAVAQLLPSGQGLSEGQTSRGPPRG